jgi:hypothetical protein
MEEKHGQGPQEIFLCFGSLFGYFANFESAIGEPGLFLAMYRTILSPR